MGNPLKLVELARRLIRLSGFEPAEDIPIEFTGMLPGEKLFEDLNTVRENVPPAYHEKIKFFSGAGLPADHAATHRCGVLSLPSLNRALEFSRQAARAAAAS